MPIQFYPRFRRAIIGGVERIVAYATTARMVHDERLGMTQDKVNELVSKGGGIVGYDQIYPVGCYIYSSDLAFDPNIAFGGTWEKVAENVTLRQAGGDHPLGVQFGEATHKLTMTELPKAKLNVELFDGTKLALNGAGASTSGKLINNNANNVWANELVALLPGGDKAHNNIGPSLAVNIWHKTADGGSAVTSMTPAQVVEFIGEQPVKDSENLGKHPPAYYRSQFYNCPTTVAGWAAQADGSYKQTVTATGVTAASVLSSAIVGVNDGSLTTAQKQAIAEALGYISELVPGANSIAFVCYDSKPEVDMTVQVTEVR